MEGEGTQDWFPPLNRPLGDFVKRILTDAEVLRCIHPVLTTIS
jgi:hypothetical protein